MAISKDILSAGSKGQKNNAICLHDTAVEVLKKADDIFNKNLVSNEMTREGESFVRAIELSIIEKGPDYIHVIQDLDPRISETGSNWLYGIEQKITAPLSVFT